MNNDSISRKWLRTAIIKMFGDSDIASSIDAIIDNAPTVPIPVDQNVWESGYECGKNERPQGEWVLMYCSCGDRYYTCSICNRAIEVKNGQSLKDYPYCHCGASMKGGAE